MEAVSDDSGPSDDDTECAVAPSDPQRQQMQKELAQFRTMLSSASQSQSGSGVDEPETPSMIQEVPSTISTERKKKKKKRTNRKKSRRQHERSNSLVSASDQDAEAPSNVPPPRENLAGCFPDTPPDPNPMLSHMLRRIDLGGIWNEEEEDRDQRGPVDIEPVTVAVEVGGA